MTSDAKGRFVRGLRSLDRHEFVVFVAALWAARGWDARTDRSAVGVDVDVRREGRRSQSIRVVAGRSAWLAIAHLSVWPADVDIVVTRGRLAAIAVDSIENHRSRATFEHAPAGVLYARFRYGIADAEQDRLCEEHLDTDFENSSTAIRLGDALDRTTGAVPTNALLAAAFVAVAIVALVVTGAVSGPFAALPSNEPPSVADTGTTGATVSPADVRTSEPTPRETTRAAVPAACPPPPTDVHPAAIRPGVVRTASTSGLEGWVIEFDGNLTDFDPNDESNRIAPEVRHLVVYETPSGRQYRLVIDRWQSAERAADRATRVESGSERAPLVWGSYSIVVESYAADAPERTAADIGVLLANVQTPDGITIGSRCVDALAEGASPSVALDRRAARHDSFGLTGGRPRRLGSSAGHVVW